MKCKCIYAVVFLVFLVRESYQHSSLRLREKNPFSRNDLLKRNTHLRKKIPPIFGGEFVMNIEECPFVALLLRFNMQGYLDNACTSSILTEKYLLTAAHCVVDTKTAPFNKTYPADLFRICAGGLSYNRRSFESIVRSIYVHPMLVLIQDPKIGVNDIALLEIRGKFRFSRKINNIPLPQLPSTSGSITRHNWKQCVAFGWGQTSLHFYSDIASKLLKVAELEIMDYEECEYTWPIINESSQICTKDSKNINGVCHGDSGGPLVCDGVLVGVTSSGDDDCIPIKGGVSTKVEYFVGWMTLYMEMRTGEYVKSKHDLLMKIILLENTCTSIAFTFVAIASLFLDKCIS